MYDSEQNLSKFYSVFFLDYIYIVYKINRDSHLYISGGSNFLWIYMWYAYI